MHVWVPAGSDLGPGPVCCEPVPRTAAIAGAPKTCTKNWHWGLAVEQMEAGHSQGGVTVLLPLLSM